MKNFIIEQVKECDAKELYTLFYDTIHTINAKDYNKDQLDVWAPRSGDISTYIQKILSKHAILARVKTLDKSVICGYGSIDKDGFLDHLYVSKDFQHEGVGSLICDSLEDYAKTNGAKEFKVEASITAKEFFIHRGYEIIQEQTVYRKGVALKNFLMKKYF